MSFLVSLALACYFMSGMLSLANSLRKTERDVALFRWPSMIALGAGLVANALWIVERWHALGFPPFAEIYGCFVLLALCVGVVAMALELALGIRFLGALSSLAAAALLIISLRFVGETRPLMPALQSAYFAPHVVSYFIAYGALTVSGLASLALLAQKSDGRAFAESQAWARRSAQIGFPFLTLGMVLGALWAQAAYTDYWGWDPKEVWALVTWLLIAAWFHLQATGRRGKLAAGLMIIAVAAMYFTLFGVGLLPTSSQSLHVYK